MSNSGADRPLYRKIADDLQAQVQQGEFTDSRLPSESDISRQYGVSRGTARQAFMVLRASGVISSRQGARRHVQAGQRVQSMGELLSFSRWARSVGEVPSSRTLHAEQVTGPEFARERLDVPADEDVFHIERVRLLSGAPVMLESTYYPLRLVPTLREIEMDTESITDRLEEAGVVLANAEHRIDAIGASQREAELLELAPGTALMRTLRHTTDATGVAVECSIDLYAGSSMSFVVRNSVMVSSTSRIRSRSG